MYKFQVRLTTSGTGDSRDVLYFENVCLYICYIWYRHMSVQMPMHIHTEARRGCLVSPPICLTTLRWALSLTEDSGSARLTGQQAPTTLHVYLSLPPKARITGTLTIPSLLCENQSIRAQVQTPGIHRIVWHGCSGL